MLTEQENSTSSSSKGIKNIQLNDHANLTLEQMRSLDYFYDVDLIAGKDGKKVSAHRLVLSAASPYFLAMFTGSMREAEENEVTLNEVRGDILQILVAFCYSGRMQLRQDTVELLLRTASMFQMNRVVDECTNYLADQLDRSNCLGFLIFAEQYNFKELQKEAEDYIHQEFTQVRKNDEFLKLNATQFAAIIASDDVNVSSEEDVFHSVIEWVKSNLSKRKQHIRQLLPLVFLNMIHKAQVNTPRLGFCAAVLENTLYAFGGFNTVSYYMNSVERWDPVECTWTFVAPMPTARSSVSAAVLNGCIYVLGGFSEGAAIRTVEYYNPHSNTWTVCAPMTVPRCSLEVAVSKGVLYSVGGKNQDDVCTPTAEYYDPVTDKWTMIEPMSKARADFGCAFLGKCMMALGGLNPNSVEEYNPKTKKWINKRSLTKAYHSVSVYLVPTRYMSSLSLQLKYR